MQDPTKEMMARAAIARKLDRARDANPDMEAAVIAPVNDSQAIRITADLRRAEIATVSFFNGNFKKQMKRANDAGVPFVVIVRDDGIALKDMETGDQQAVNMEDVRERLQYCLDYDYLEYSWHEHHGRRFPSPLRDKT